MIHNINLNLTYEAASKNGFIYAGNFVIDENHPEKLSKTLRYGLENGCVAGQAFIGDGDDNIWAKGIVYGYYIPKDLNLVLLPQLIIDQNLHQWSYKKRGYRLIETVEYDPAKGFLKLIDTLMRIWDSGYTLGVTKWGDPKLFGVYTEINSPSSKKVYENSQLQVTYYRPEGILKSAKVYSPTESVSNKYESKEKKS